MFWGLTLRPGEPCTKVLDKSVCLSMAALESRQAIGSGFTQVLIQADGVDHLLCTLMSGVIFQQYMNVKLSEGEKITLSIEGTGVVHLTGFTFQRGDERNEMGQHIPEEGYCDDLEGQLQGGPEYSVKVGDSLGEGEGWELASDVGDLSSADAPHYTEPTPATEWLSSSENTTMIAPIQTNISHGQPSEHFDLPEGGVQDLREGSIVVGETVAQSNSQQMAEKEPDLSPISTDKILKTGSNLQIPSDVILPGTSGWSRDTGITKNTPRFVPSRRVLRTKRFPQRNAEAEDIEERRLRWRLAKREQRKKNKLKALMSEELASIKSGGYSLSKGKRTFTASGRNWSQPAAKEAMVDHGQGHHRRSINTHVQHNPSMKDGRHQDQRLKTENNQC